MTKFKQLTIAAIISLSMAGCTSHQSNRVSALESLDERIPIVYKVEVPQGNIVTAEMDRQIKPGLNQEQVKALMGTPLLVDLFNQNRWDYYYLFRPGRGKPEQHHMIVFFDKHKKVEDVIHSDVAEGQTPAPSNHKKWIFG